MADLEPLDQCPQEILEKLVYSVIDSIGGGLPPRIPDYGKTFTPGVFRTVVSGLGSLIKAASRNIDQTEDVLNNSGAPNNVVNTLSDAIKTRYHDIRQALINETVGTGSASLVDFDWSVKVAVSSDSMSSLMQPLLHLSFKVRQTDGSLDTVKMELSQEELQELINKMENANEAVRALKV